MASPGVACLKPGGTYRAAGQIHLVGAMLMTLDGQGATINHPIRGNSPVVLIDQGGSGVTLRNVTIKGVNPAPGQWTYAYEHEHGIAFGGVTNVLVERVTILNVGGDGFYLGGGANRWMDNVTIRNNVIDGSGRMGIATTDGVSNLLFADNVLRNQGYYCMDHEPNGVQVGGRLAGLEHGKFLRNVCGPVPYGNYPQDPTQADGFAWVATGASGGGVCSDIEVAFNRVDDATYPDFRWNNFMSCTGLNVHDNVRQVKH